MPNFLNTRIPGAKQVRSATGMMRLNYTQACKLPSRWVYMVLNTQDRGSKGRPANHWWRYYAKPKSVLSCKRSTKHMIEFASKMIERQLLDSLPLC